MMPTIDPSISIVVSILSVGVGLGVFIWRSIVGLEVRLSKRLDDSDTKIDKMDDRLRDVEKSVANVDGFLRGASRSAPVGEGD